MLIMSIFTTPWVPFEVVHDEHFIYNAVIYSQNQAHQSNQL